MNITPAMLAAQLAKCHGKPAPAMVRRRKVGEGRRGMAKKAFASVVLAQPPGGRTCLVPIRTVSEANVRDHYHVKARRAAQQREVVTWFVRRLDIPPLPVVVTLTRVGKKRMDDDNAVRSAKAVRDAVAAVLGIDDADPRVRWVYGPQEIGEYGVRVEIQPEQP